MGETSTTNARPGSRPTPDDLARLPKVELHLHLDCCMRFAVAAQLSPGLSEREYRDRFVAPARCRDFAEWVTRVDPALDLLQTAHGLRLLTADLFRQLRADGVVYAEIRFAPLLHTRRGLSPEAAIRAVEDAAVAAIDETGVEARLILCTLRHLSPEDSLLTAELAVRSAGGLVAGLDIAGDEERFPAAAHAAAFALAARHGLSRTAHAGEGSGAASVREALDLLAPTRIGHGVRSVEDPALVERLGMERIHLEVCPASNVQTGAMPSLPEHPVDRLFRAGVPLGISTDARAVVDTTLSEEYARLSRTHGWGIDEFRRCNHAALDAAFIPNDVRERIRSRIGSHGT